MNAAIAVGLLLAGAYAGLGLVFAAVFQAMGLKRFDHAAARAGWGFRLIITPGIVALWPVLLALWVKRRGSDGPPSPPANEIPPRTLRTWHRVAWYALAALVPVALVLALAQRPPVPEPATIPWSPSNSR